MKFIKSTLHELKAMSGSRDHSALFFHNHPDISEYSDPNETYLLRKMAERLTDFSAYSIMTKHSSLVGFLSSNCNLSAFSNKILLKIMMDIPSSCISYNLSDTISFRRHEFSFDEAVYVLTHKNAYSTFEGWKFLFTKKQFLDVASKYEIVSNMFFWPTLTDLITKKYALCIHKNPLFKINDTEEEKVASLKNESKTVPEALPCDEWKELTPEAKELNDLKKMFSDQGSVLNSQIELNNQQRITISELREKVENLQKELDATLAHQLLHSQS